MSGGKSDLCLFPQQPGPVPALQSPLFPRGSWGIPAKHLEWEGPQKWAEPGPSGGGEVPALPLPVPSHPLTSPPTLSLLETEDLLFSIIYNLRIGPPVLSSPLT